MQSDSKPKIFAVSSMQRMITQIGTPQDNQQLQNQLWEKQQYPSELNPLDHHYDHHQWRHIFHHHGDALMLD